MNQLKNKFYDLNRILKRERQWNMIFGVRGNGKTYALKKHCIIEFLKYQKEFVWVRRTATTMDLCSPNWLTDLKNDEDINKLIPEGYYINTTRKYIELKPIKVDKEIEGFEDMETLVMGYFIPLSTSEKIKSISYENVHTLVFDEVLTFGTYLPNEINIFLGLMSSIERNRYDTVKVFLLSNNTSVDNPYFRYLGMNMSVIQPDVITNFKTMGCIHICDKKSVELANEYKKTITYWFGSFGNFNDYSEKGKFIMDNNDFVEKLKAKKFFKFNVVINGKTIGVWEVKKPNPKHTIPIYYFSNQINIEGKTHILMKEDFKGVGNENLVLNGRFAPVWKEEIHSCNVRYETLEIKKNIILYIVSHLI